ncbi:hypothetical protein [Streptococcus jiangjianxini]|uniref:hypothetical protein n=1 Tax=Streptococcus jiangjianxini TaxID=3161189 RepID=UPI0032EBD20A
MKKSVNIILIIESLLFYSCFVLDFDFLFPNHWATVVTLIINPILSLIGVILAIWYKRWLSMFGLIMYFFSFPISMAAGYLLEAFKVGWDISPTSLYVITALWIVFLMIAFFTYRNRHKITNRLDRITFSIIYLPALLVLIAISLYVASHF